MKVAVLTKNFIGGAGEFSRIKGDLIGGAEIYLYELISRVLEPLCDEIRVYQINGVNRKFNKTTVRTVRSFLDVDLDNHDLIILNDIDLLRKIRGPKNRDNIIAIHHGMKLEPTILNPNTLNIIWKYRISRSGRSKAMRTLRKILALAYFSIRNEVSRFKAIKSLNDADAPIIVSVDRNSLKYLLPTRKSRWIVIHNFVDLNLFNPNVEPTLRFDDSCINILVPRNLSFGRGVFILPELVQFLKEHKCSKFRFLIVGDGILREYLEKYADDHIVLLGHRDHFSEMPGIYASSDIVLIPSFCSEGTSFAVLEGMATKKPIVTTDVGGIKEIGINGVHKLSSPFSTRMIGMNILRLIRDRRLSNRIAGNAHHYVRNNHDVKTWVDKWTKLIINIVSGRR